MKQLAGCRMVRCEAGRGDTPSQHISLSASYLNPDPPASSTPLPIRTLLLGGLFSPAASLLFPQGR